MLKHLIPVLLLTLFIACMSKGPQRVEVEVPKTSEPVAHEVHYIANEGVLIKTPAGNILIDAIHDLYDQKYMYTPESVMDDIMAANYPFENIDAIMITHVHSDHFDAQLIGQYLQRHPVGLLAAQQVCDSVRKHWPSATFLEQLIEIEQDQEITDFSFKDIKVKAIKLEHSAASFNGWVQNFGYHIELGGRTYIHLGDAEITPKNLDNIEAAAGNAVDMAILPFWWLYTNGQNWMKARFFPGAIIGVHVKVPDSHQFEEALEAQFPNLEIFNESMEKVIIKE
ncbi:MAG: MBL fold metallo-hydrolase [Bacteroidota bacterium]